MQKLRGTFERTPHFKELYNRLAEMDIEHPLEGIGAEVHFLFETDGTVCVGVPTYTGLIEYSLVRTLPVLQIEVEIARDVILCGRPTPSALENFERQCAAILERFPQMTEGTFDTMTFALLQRNGQVH
jgi:hypothetical protein